MPSLPLNVFCKSPVCPASSALLAYRNSGLAFAERARVEAHLDYCEFCGAELQLLDNYKPESCEVTISEIPPSLRLLAETLLPGHIIGFDSLERLVDHHHLAN